MIDKLECNELLEYIYNNTSYIQGYVADELAGCIEDYFKGRASKIRKLQAQLKAEQEKSKDLESNLAWTVEVKEAFKRKLFNDLNKKEREIQKLKEALIEARDNLAEYRVSGGYDKCEFEKKLDAIINRGGE